MDHRTLLVVVESVLKQPTHRQDVPPPSMYGGGRPIRRYRYTMAIQLSQRQLSKLGAMPLLLLALLGCGDSKPVEEVPNGSPSGTDADVDSCTIDPSFVSGTCRSEQDCAEGELCAILGGVDPDYSKDIQRCMRRGTTQQDGILCPPNFSCDVTQGDPQELRCSYEKVPEDTARSVQR